MEYDLRRISQNSYQIVLIDQTDNIETSQKAAEKISQALMFKYQSYGFYFWTEFSGTSPPSALKKYISHFKKFRIFLLREINFLRYVPAQHCTYLCTYLEPQV